MPRHRPLVIVIAGPNGAGKSTTAPWLLRDALQVSEFVNADAIAGGLSAFRPDSVAIPAGRAMLERMQHLADAQTNFAFETTLASRSFAPWLARLKRSGYQVHVLFLWLESADLGWIVCPPGCGWAVTMCQKTLCAADTRGGCATSSDSICPL